MNLSQNRIKWKSLLIGLILLGNFVPRVSSSSSLRMAGRRGDPGNEVVFWAPCHFRNERNRIPFVLHLGQNERNAMYLCRIIYSECSYPGRILKERAIHRRSFPRNIADKLLFAQGRVRLRHHETEMWWDNVLRQTSSLIHRSSQ